MIYVYVYTFYQKVQSQENQTEEERKSSVLLVKNNDGDVHVSINGMDPRRWKRCGPSFQVTLIIVCSKYLIGNEINNC